MAPILFALVQPLTLFVFLAGAVSFAVLVKGCYVLRHIARGSTRDDSGVLLKSPLIPSVSAVATPRDASPANRDFIRLLIGLHYSEHEVVVVLDGPTPEEMEIWTREFRLVPSSHSAVRDHSPALSTATVRGIYTSRDPLRLVVVEKDRGGEADALNAAVNVSRCAVLAFFDPEATFVPDALLRLIRPMLENPREISAVVGIAPTPPGESWAGRFAAIESLRLWLSRCAAFAGWNMLLPVPGSALLVRRDSVLNAKGFTAGILELILQLHGLARGGGKPFSVGFVPDFSYLRPPGTIAELQATIRRDQRDIGRVYAHRGSIAQKGGAIGWGLTGMVTMRLLRPLAETILYPLTILGLVMRWIPLQFGAVVLMATVGTGILVSMAAVVLRELAQYRGADPSQLTRLFLAAIPENLGYRQLRNLWLIASFFG